MSFLMLLKTASMDTIQKPVACSGQVVQQSSKRTERGVFQESSPEESLVAFLAHNF